MLACGPPSQPAQFQEPAGLLPGAARFGRVCFRAGNGALSAADQGPGRLAGAQVADCRPRRGGCPCRIPWPTERG